MVTDAKARARQKELEFDHRLTTTFVREWIQRSPTCACCEVPFTFEPHGSKNRNPKTPSLDRFDSTKGYTLDNVALLCWRCNDVKGNASIEELEMVASWMRKRGDD